MPTILRSSVFHFDEICLEIDQGDVYRLSEEKEKIVNQHRLERWSLSLKTERPQWNGTFYRVLYPEKINSSDPIRLSLASIEYRYIVCRKEYGKFFFDTPTNHLNFLSVATLLETSDGKFLFGERCISKQYDIIGGGITMEETTVTTGSDIKKHLLAEVFEEVGVDQRFVAACTGLGVLYSQYSNVLFIAHTKLMLSGDEIGDYFLQRTDNEMAGYVLVEKNDLHRFLRTLREYRPLVAELAPTF